MKGSTRSPARNGAAGIPPAPTAPKPKRSLRASPPSATAATTRSARSPSAPTSPHQWLPAKRLELARQHLSQLRPQDPAPHPPRPRPQAAPPAAARSTSNGSTTRCCTPTTAPGPSPRRPSTRSTSIIRGALDRRRAPRARDPQRRARRLCTQAAGDPQGRATSLDRRRAPALPARCRRSPAVPRPVAVGQHRDAPHRAARAEVVRPRRGERSACRSTADSSPVGYELHESRGKTDNSRRCIDLDDTTLAVLAGWRALQAAEFAAVGIDDPGWMFTSADGRARAPPLDQPDLRPDRATRPGPRHPVPRSAPHPRPACSSPTTSTPRSSSERLGHAEFVFTVQTYQHTFPGMHADAARVIEALLTPRATENPKLAKAG